MEEKIKVQVKPTPRCMSGVNGLVMIKGIFLALKWGD
jgi:hypothetical protein